MNLATLARVGRTLLAGAACLALSVPVHAHGGTYRGPGDTVPPGGSGRAGRGTGPPTPGAPTGLGSGGNAAGPTHPTSRSPVTTPGGFDPAVDLTQWSFWWGFNKDPYLRLKSRVHSGAVRTGSGDWFLGDGQRDQGRDTLRPTAQQIEQEVVPALLQALEQERDNDIVTGCLVALAKIGEPLAEDGSSGLAERFAGFLSDPSQEISETAAIALGILAHESSVPILVDLLNDTEAGRARVQTQTQVDQRTRAFAAFGLALVGARTSRPGVRLTITETLSRALGEQDSADRDVKVAVVVALGLVPLQELGEEEAPSGDEPTPCRRAQLDLLLDYFRSDENPGLVRAHVPTALVRLLEGTPEAWRGFQKLRIARELLASLKPSRNEPNEVVQSCALALGRLGDLDEDKVDREIRAALLAVPEQHADQQARRFALVAAAELVHGARPGADTESGLNEVSAHLAKTLSRGKSEARPWAGLALGVLGNGLGNQPFETRLAAENALALRHALAQEKSDSRLGAYAIAAGISHDQEATSLLLDRLERTRNDTTRGYLCLGLGLLGAREALDPMRSVVQRSKYRPELLQQAAIALGLLGDKALVPELIDRLEQTESSAISAALCQALGFIGDSRSIGPLVNLLAEGKSTRARGFAAVALGIVADKEPLPWNAKIGVGLNYRAATHTLTSLEGTGILNIL